MIKNQSILAIIPARGGSKGLPGKNIRDLAGKPLLAWTIEEAKRSKYIDKCILSSDDEKIIEVAQKYDCDVPFVRPNELAQDDTPGIDVILHAVNYMSHYDYILMLQPTSPLRTINDIDGCIEYCINNGASACVSICEVSHSPYWMYTLNENKKMLPILSTKKEFYRRQALPTVYQLNGAVYIAQREWLIKNKNFVTEETAGYCMPIDRSIDIDCERDFKVAQSILNTK